MKKIVSIICFLIFGLLGVIIMPKQQVQAMRVEDLFANFTSNSYILVDCDSNTILYGKNTDQKMPVASICKLMTALLTLEKIDRKELDLNDKFVVSEYASSVEGSQAFLDAGSEYTVKDLLKSVIVASANDSAIVLAENIGGNEDNFVKMMNNKAKDLGMKNTVYSNSTGLPKSNQYSTVLDTALLLKAVGKYDLYKEYCSIWMDKIVHPSGRETDLVNTNRLIKYYSSCKCGKTGFTDESGYCLSAMAEKNDMNLIAVALNCKTSADRFKECMELFNYGFSNFENKKLIDKDIALQQEIDVIGGEYQKAKLVPKNDFYIVNKLGDNENIEIRYELPDKISAPCKTNDCVGKIIILKKGVLIGEVEIVLKENIDKQTFGDILNKMFNNWSL